MRSCLILGNIVKPKTTIIIGGSRRIKKLKGERTQHEC